LSGAGTEDANVCGGSWKLFAPTSEMTTTSNAAKSSAVAGTRSWIWCDGT
jgi:hypothetical protein